MRDIFAPRRGFKPFEFPELEVFKEGIQHSFWLWSEWNFMADIQDFHTNLTEPERNAIKNSLLAISQIEVSVKKFWSKLGDRFPKPEFDQVGICFAESEVRHADAYSHLIEILGLNDDFSLLLENPVIQGRVDYLTKYLRGASDSTNENYALTLTLFSLFIENVSLFSQFLVVKAFNKRRNLLKDIDNVIQATQQEENLHAQLGIYILSLVREQNPEWFNEEFYAKIERAARKAYVAESAIVDWIFELGELDFLSKETVNEFIKDRMNQSVIAIGGKPVFEIDQTILSNVKWFYEELNGGVAVDFFNKKSTAYTKMVQPYTEDDLF